MNRLAQWLSVCLCGLLCACGKPRAGGDPREITTFADDRVWAAVESTVIHGLERKVMLLDEESVFWVHGVGAETFEQTQRRPLVLFLASADEKGPVGTIVSAVTGTDLETLAATTPFSRLVDPWARGQMAYLVVGSSIGALDSLVTAALPRIYEGFYSRYEASVEDLLYVRGEDARRARYLMTTYGWSLRVPRPWDMEEKAPERWVHFVKTEPDRHVSVYWEEWPDSTWTPEYCLRLRRDLAWRHYDEDEVDDSRTGYSWVTFQGRKALEISGAWVNQKYVAGGPFRTVCFWVEEQHRLYLLDLVAFAPDRPKFYVMTQLGIVAKTFATAPAAPTRGA